MKPTLAKHGYFVINLYKNKKRKQFYIHRLLAKTFLNGEGYINHKDGNKQNNSLDNLEFCTQQHNMIHAVELGLHKPRGEDNGGSILTECNVREIRSLLKSGELSRKKIAEKFGVAPSTIGDIKAERTWRHLT